MNQKSFNRTNLVTLLENLDDGVLEPAGRDELYDLLMSSAEARKVYHDYMGFVAVLQDEVRTQAEKNLLPILPGSNQRRVRRNFTYAVVYAAAILLLTIIVARFVMAPEIIPYARVTPSADIIWNLTQGELGENTPPGVITLGSTIHVTHGSLNISLPDGTEMILVGPATLRFPESLYQPELKKGRLWVDSNYGKKSFSVLTNGYLVKDIGTRFGIFAEDSIEVHVFEGKVQIIDRKSNEERASLKAREAITVSASGESSIIPLVSGPFPAKEHTATSIRFAQNFIGKSNLLDRGWVPLAGNWKQGKDGLTCLSSGNGVLVHEFLPAKAPFFVSLDFQFTKAKSSSTDSEQWAGVAWSVPIAGAGQTRYLVFRVRQDNGRITLSSLDNHSDTSPVKLVSSAEDGGDLGALSFNQDYRITVTSGNDGEITGRLFDLSSGDKALATLRGEVDSPDRGNLGIYTRHGKNIYLKKFVATSRLRKKNQ